MRLKVHYCTHRLFISIKNFNKSTMEINIEKYLEKEYEVYCGDEKVTLKPQKAWLLGKNRKRAVVIGLFKCPDGRTVRKKLDVVELQSLE